MRVRRITDTDLRIGDQFSVFGPDDAAYQGLNVVLQFVIADCEVKTTYRTLTTMVTDTNTGMIWFNSFLCNVGLNAYTGRNVYVWLWSRDDKT